MLMLLLAEISHMFVSRSGGHSVSMVPALLHLHHQHRDQYGHLDNPSSCDVSVILVLAASLRDLGLPQVLKSQGQRKMREIGDLATGGR